jgi:hypothetical protein
MEGNGWCSPRMRRHSAPACASVCRLPRRRLWCRVDRQQRRPRSRRRSARSAGAVGAPALCPDCRRRSAGRAGNRYDRGGPSAWWRRRHGRSDDWTARGVRSQSMCRTRGQLVLNVGTEFLGGWVFGDLLTKNGCRRGVTICDEPTAQSAALFVNSIDPVPAPILGAGLPGLIAALGAWAYNKYPWASNRHGPTTPSYENCHRTTEYEVGYGDTRPWQRPAKSKQ